MLFRGFTDIFNHHSSQLCTIIAFLSHLAELLSALYIVSFTIQRFIAVRHPLQVAIRSQSSVLISSIVIFICSFIFCLIISTQGSYDDCHEDLSLSWFIADAIVSFVIPFSLISTFNLLIVYSVRQHSKSQIRIQSIVIKGRKTSISLFSLRSRGDWSSIHKNSIDDSISTSAVRRPNETMKSKFHRPLISSSIEHYSQVS